MHHGNFEGLDLALMLFATPLLGTGFGLFFGMVLGRPGRAAIAGAAGGAAGAWAGGAVYWFALLPHLHDPLIFSGCVLAGFLLGAVSLGFSMAGPSEATRTPAFQPPSGALGFSFGGVLGLFLGIFLAYLTIVPGTAAGMEMLGYFTGPAFCAMIGAPAGLIAVLVLRERRQG